MAAEMLDKVLQKEAQAAAKEEAAAKEAAQITAAAKEEAQRLIQAAQAQCALDEKEKLEQANAQAQKLLATAQQDAEKYADGLCKNAGQKLSEAVGLVKKILSA